MNYKNTSTIEILNKNLIDIGNKLSDFEEIENPTKNLKYTILGRGNFGYAEKMKCKKNNMHYAIKKLDKDKINIKNFHREIEIMSLINHENIVKFYGYFEDKENINKYKEIYKDKKTIDQEKGDKTIFCLVLEYIPNGSLNDYIEKYKALCKKKNVFLPLKEDFLIKIFKQILSALVYLSNNSIMHRDIKPDNILFDKNYNVKISDFGLAVLYNDKNWENKNMPEYLFFGCSRVGRNDFISPEVYQGQKYDFENDVFSLGLTMLCLMSSDNPIKLYKDLKTKDTKRNIDINKINKSYNKYLKDLVLLMINNDPMLRPTAQQAYDSLIQIENNMKKKTTIDNTKKNETTTSKLNTNPLQIKQFEQNENIDKLTKSQTFQNYQNIPNFQNITQYNMYYRNSYIYPNNQMYPNLEYNIQNNLAYPSAIFNTNTNIVYNNALNNPNNVQGYNSPNTLIISPKQNDQNNNKVFKNTSLVRVIQCICRCIKDNIKSKIKSNNNNLDIVNIMEITTLKISNKINTEKFIQNINDFKQNLSTKNEIFKGEEEISPKIVFLYIFNIMNEDFINNKINWTNNLFNGFVESDYYPKCAFPEIYEKIDKFNTKLKNPFVDYFYYIYLELTKCPNCKYIIKNKAHTPYFISLPSNPKDKISNLIKDYFADKPAEIKCKKCSNNGIKINAFFNTPKFLMINFDGEEKNEKILDDIIDLSPYPISNIGPKKYKLYAFITKDNDEYRAIIKNEKHNNWHLFSGIDTITMFDFHSNNYYFPIIVIYKGLD